MNDSKPNEFAPVVHVIATAAPTPYFRALVENGRLGARAIVVGSVGPAGELQDDLRSLGVRTFALNASNRHALPVATARLARLLRGVNASVVQAHLLDGCLVGLAAGRLARTPVTVYTAHHSHELPVHGLRLIVPDALCIRVLADHVIAPSEQVAVTLQRYTRVPRSKLAIVHHGFDLTRLDPDALDRDAIRAELGLTGKLVFGAVGRLYPVKNYRALITAYASVLGHDLEARLVIVGPGAPEELRAHARREGVGDSVLFLGPRHDVAAVMYGFDVFVHPSLAESFGMVLVEAMAMRRPVLCTPFGVAPELITHGLNGLLTTGTDVSAIAAGLGGMLALRARWRELGAQARVSSQTLTAERMATGYEQLYAAWLADSSASR